MELDSRKNESRTDMKKQDILIEVRAVHITLHSRKEP